MTGQIAKQQDDVGFEVAADEIVSTSKKAPGAFRTISEVAEELNVQQHVLRFWETKFAQVKPLKRGGGRRYYRPEDVLLLKKIHMLLYIEGYTIKGVQKLLKTQGKAHLLAEMQPQSMPTKHPAPANETKAAVVQSTSPTGPAVEISDKQRSILQAMLGDLRDLRNMIAVEK